MHFAIGGDEFDVPSSVIISGDVFFLPASQQDALRFSLKPGDGRGELMVSAQAASGVCKAAAADSRNGACTEANTPVWSVDRLERRNLDRQGTQWEYVNLAPPSDTMIVLGLILSIASHLVLYVRVIKNRSGRRNR